MKQRTSPLDSFAPGLREHIGDTRDQLVILGRVLGALAPALRVHILRRACAYAGVQHRAVFFKPTSQQRKPLAQL